jgi:alpha-1,2-glucosyltransferase
MLYIWPLITFFSLPLIVPIGISFLQYSLSLLQLPLFPRLVIQYVLVAASTILALVASLLIIKYNTIIHPFTLADNRHYMFYIFRYTILKHPLIRYLLAPIYLICGYLVYLTLCGPLLRYPGPKFKFENRGKGISHPVASGHSEYLVHEPSRKEQEGPKLSFALILLLTTALSLITAPLVEPRYFILPWVIWRLNVPSLTPNSDAASVVVSKPAENGARQDSGLSGRILASLNGYDYRLWLETAWFLLINAVTGYVFLYRGFEWTQEPGKIQRFMW